MNRSTSATLLTSPSDTRTAPVLLPSMHSRKSSTVRCVSCSGCRKHDDSSVPVRPSAISPPPGLQKQPVRSEMFAAFARSLDDAVIDGAAVRAVEVERHDAAAAIGRRRAVEPDERRAVGLPERQEVLEQPAGQAADALVNRVDADRLDVLQADLDGRQRQVVERAVLEAPIRLRPDSACRPAPTRR